MAYFQAFGLTILSPISLPELPGGTAPDDIEIRFDGIDASVDVRPLRQCTYADAQVACFAWRDAGRFLVRRGREIIVDPAPGATEEAIRQHLVGELLAMALHQRGLLVLHGSAVSISSRAAIFLGQSGQGKSTTAAALTARGRRLLADDIVALDLEGDHPRLVPGVTTVNLWPDSSRIVGFASTAGQRFVSGKRSFRNAAHSGSERIGVGSIYVLNIASNIGGAQLRPAEGLLELFNHSFGPELLEFGLAGPIFAKCSEVATATPVKRLSRTASFEHLPELVELVERDMQHLS